MEGKEIKSLGEVYSEMIQEQQATGIFPIDLIRGTLANRKRQAEAERIEREAASKRDAQVKSQIDRNTRDRQTMNPTEYFGTGTTPKPEPAASKSTGGLTAQQKAEKLAQQRRETQAAGRLGSPGSLGDTSSRPTPTPVRGFSSGGETSASTVVAKPQPKPQPKPQLTPQQKKDQATNKTYQQLRKTDPAKAKEFGMKANQAKFGKDFAKPKTPNPLMKDMPGRNKAELERVRGNAAIASIAKSPNAKKILNTSKIGQASLNRSQFGSSTKPQPPKPTIMKNSLDIFDIIKGHLLDEGYAETEESAMVIMTNMSEEWRDEIVERYKGKHGQSSDEYKRDRSEGGKMVSGDDKQSGAEYTHGRRVKAENPGSQPDEGGKTKPKSQGKMDRGTRADLEYRKANLKKKEAEKKETKKEETELLQYPSEKKITVEQIIALNKKYGKV